MFEWANGWRDFEDDRRRRYFEGEFAWEIAESPGHPFFGATVAAVGFRGGYDNILVRLEGRDEFAWVLLSWTRERQPECVGIGDAEAVNRFIADWPRIVAEWRGEPSLTTVEDEE